MGRGDPLPVAVPVRDFGNVGGDCPSAWPGAGPMNATRPAVDNCNQEECQAFHDGSSVQYASVNEFALKPMSCLFIGAVSFQRFGPRRARSSSALSHHTRSADAKQLDDSIGETFVSVDFASAR